MALDLDAVAQALAAAVTNAHIVVNGVELVALDYMPESPPGTGLLFAVAEFTNNYQQTFDESSTVGGKDRYVMTCRLFAPRGDAATGQRILRKTMSNTSDSTSLIAVLKTVRGAPGQRALSGVADDCAFQTVRGPRMYGFGAPEVSLYGLELSFLVVG